MVCTFIDSWKLTLNHKSMVWKITLMEITMFVNFWSMGLPISFDELWFSCEYFNGSMAWVPEFFSVSDQGFLSGNRPAPMFYGSKHHAHIFSLWNWPSTPFVIKDPKLTISIAQYSIIHVHRYLLVIFGYESLIFISNNIHIPHFSYCS